MSKEAGIRLDKWLWYARFFKTRSIASGVCSKGKVRVDGTTVHKAHCIIRVGSVLTFPKASEICVVRVEGLGNRRGPAREAQLLYTRISESTGRLPISEK